MPHSRRSQPLSSRPPRAPTGGDGFAAKLMVGVLLLFLFAAPWPFGGVEMTRWLWPVPLTVVACWTWMLGRSSAPTPIAPWATIPVLLALAFAAFQLTPLPGEWLAQLSPESLHHWRNAEALTQPVGESTFLSAPISLEPESGKLQMTWLVLGLCVFVAAAQFLRSEFGMVGLFATTAVVGAMLAGFAVAQGARYGGKLYGVYDLATRSTPFGPFVNRNHGGAFMNLCLAGAAGLCWYLTKRGRDESDSNQWTLDAEPLRVRLLEPFRNLTGVHVLAFAAVVFALGGLVASVSRGALASAVVGLIVALVAGHFQRRSTQRSLFGLYAALVILLLAACAFVLLIGAERKAITRLSTLVQESDAGQRSRVQHWRDMVPATRDFARAGAGLGSYFRVHRLYTPNNRGYLFEHADNTYLELLVELGLPGVVLIALFILLCIRAIVVVLRRDRALGRAFAVGAAFVLTTQVVHHAVDFPLYSPANLVLFAAWMGAVCGRAGRMESASRSERRSPWLVALPLGRWQMAGALPAGLLLALGGWAWWEAAAQERINWTLGEHRRRPATARTPLERVDAWVQELEAMAAACPSRADLRYELAGRWIDRCRVQATQAVLKSDPNQNEDELWRKSDLLYLYGQLFGAARKGRGAELEAVRHSPAVSENLPRAKEQLLAACQLSPLYVEPRLRLAAMPYLLESPAKREMLVDQAAALAPGDADVLFQVGMLEYHADRRDKVLPAWRKSLEISQTWVKPIFFQTLEWLGAKRAIDEALPPDPALLVNFGEQILAAPEAIELRDRVFQRALQALPEASLPKADRNELAGRAFVGLAKDARSNTVRSDFYGKAVHCFEEAAQDVKGRPYLWLTLGDCYEKLGRPRDAARVVGVAAGLMPDRPDIVNRAVQLRDKAEKSQIQPDEPHGKQKAPSNAAVAPSKKG